jgi:hypothetical protein
MWVLGGHLTANVLNSLWPDRLSVHDQANGKSRVSKSPNRIDRAISTLVRDGDVAHGTRASRQERHRNDRR